MTFLFPTISHKYELYLHKTLISTQQLKVHLDKYKGSLLKWHKLIVLLLE